MSLLELLLLGLVQGLTEFLPVSSSGHLALAEQYLAARGGSLPSGFALELALHGGTLLAVLVAFRRDLWGLRRRESRRLVGLVVLGCVPAGVVGLTAKAGFEALKASLPALGLAFVYAGLAMILFERLGRRATAPAPAAAAGEAPLPARGEGVGPAGGLTLAELTPGAALLIGLAQAVAIAPGVSRAGLTIAAALALGLERRAAVVFSFLLMLPAVGGALLLEARHALNGATAAAGAATAGLPAPLWMLALGALGAGLTGLVALRLLVRLVRGAQLWTSGVYCVIVGLLALGWGLARLGG